MPSSEQSQPVKKSKKFDARAEALRELSIRHLIDFCHSVDTSFQSPLHLRRLGEKLEEVESGQIRKLMVFMPPRHGKSEMTSNKFPAWALGRNPNRRFIHSSYSAELSNSFSRNVRNLIEMPEYTNIFPGVALASDSKAKDDWSLQGLKGGFLSSGVGGSITGRGADIFLIDDPIKNLEEANSETYRNRIWEWYRTVVRTRLEPRGAVILIMTRWHADDLAGRLLKHEKDNPEEDGEKWTVINFPALALKDDPLGREEGEALWPGRYSRSELKTIKNESGTRNWSSLYMGNPMDPESQIIKREWFTDSAYYDELPSERLLYGGIDTATSLKTSADNTSLVDVATNPFKPGFYYVDDVFCEKVSVHVFSAHVCAQHAAKKYVKIQMEKNKAGDAMKQVIDKEGRENKTHPPIEGIDTSTDKVVRVMAFQHMIENGTLKFKRGNKKVAELIEHLINFDGKGSDIDDDVDGLGFAIEAAKSGLGESVAMASWDVSPS